VNPKRTRHDEKVLTTTFNGGEVEKL